MIEDKGYKDFSDFLKEHFNFKVQKIAVNAGFTCPNRDGNKGTGGCTYCNNQTFNPEYCKPQLSVSEQLEKGKTFFGAKYPSMKYLAYFQAYTNTYGDIDKVIEMYEEALLVEDVVGIIIGTRPDCMPQRLLEYLSTLSHHKFVLVEYGVETSNDKTLQLINRGHTWQDTVEAVTRTHSAGVMCGIHIILGLPSENINDYIATADSIAKLPIVTLKMHQLQLIKGTVMARQVATGELSVQEWDAKGYIDVCIEILKHIPPRIAIERFVSQSPDNLLISPRWGLKNYQFTNILNNKIKSTNTIQGKI